MRNARSIAWRSFAGSVVSATGRNRLTPIRVEDDHLVGGGEVEADSSGLRADEEDEMVAGWVLEAVDHVHPLVLVGLPGEDVERKAGHWVRRVEGEAHWMWK